MRGILTDEIKSISKSFLGREINIKELRLIPYIIYTLSNLSRFDINKLSTEEIDILDNLSDEGHIQVDDHTMEVTSTKKYFDFCNEIIWLGYVNKGSE